MPIKTSISVVFLTLIFSIVCLGQIPITVKPALFKSWSRSSTAVWGLSRLTNVDRRRYFKIWKADPLTVKVEEHDVSGAAVGVVTIRFSKGMINQVVSTNRWGETTQTINAVPAGPGQVIVTQSSYGENDLFPAKSARYIYKANLLTELRYLSYDGKLTPDENGVAIIRYKRYIDGDRYSLIKEMEFFDENDLPTVSRGFDAHKVVYEYDQRGNRLSQSIFGLDDQPVKNRFGYFTTKNRYNDRDQLISVETFGLSDESVNNSYGVAKVEYEYVNGLAVKEVRMDPTGRVTKASSAGDGIAIIRYEYDANGLEKRRSYFDEADRPMNGPNGYQAIAYTNSPTGMLTRVEYFDTSGGPAQDRVGIHRYDYERDELGRAVSVAFFDKQNKPMMDESNEVYMIKYKYNEAGRRYSTSYWKSAEEKMARWDGYHESVSRFNDDGQLIESLRYGMDGKLFVSKSGSSRVIISYDSLGRVEERAWFNDKVPAVLTGSFSNGYHVIRFSYDAKGRIANLRYFDPAKKPVNAEITLDDKLLRYHRVEFIYQGNRIVEQRLYAAGSDVPDMIINCLTSNYINTDGVSMGRKNQ